jgi:hypothetical protein
MVTISAHTSTTVGSAVETPGSFALELTRSLNHELRGALHTVAGFSGLLARSPLAEDQQAALEWIQRATGRMTILLEGVTDVVRAASTPCLGPEIVDPLEVVFEVCGRITPLVEEAEVTVITAIERDEPVLGEGTAVVEVLERLLVNALQHSGASRVVLAVGPGTPGTVRFSVEDTGRGMTEHELNRAFDPFVRFVDPDLEDGAGVGLTVCRLLVEAMGSKLAAASRPGEGTRLWFELPIRA